MRLNLDCSLDHLEDGSPYRDLIFGLVSWAESQGRIIELLRGARQENPGNPDLQSLARELGLLELDVDGHGLRRARVRLVHHIHPARDFQSRPEFDQLCDEWRQMGANGVGVCALIGMGGAGKTAIAERFIRVLPDLLPEHSSLPKDSTLPAPTGLFVFSFYDAPNPDAFFGETAAWLTNTVCDAPSRQLSYEQIIQLLERTTPCVFVLDGLEKVQEDGLRGGTLGRITDGRLRDFVIRVAEGWLPAVSLIITTRFAPFDPLERRSHFYRAIPVESLSPDAAVALLRARGVRQGTDAQLREIAEDQGRHALTVDLMGGYIQLFCGGDPARLPAMLPLKVSENPESLTGVVAPHSAELAAVRRQEERFARIAERYREALAADDPAALAILQRVCLFRLGVDAGALTSIFTGSQKLEISGPELAALTPAQVQETLDRLVMMRLLEAHGSDRPPTDPPSDEGATRYTVHPAVRDGFSRSMDRQITRRGHDAAREAMHARLKARGPATIVSSSLQGVPDSQLPSDPATLDLLEEIMFHTLKAGHPAEAWSIYEARIGGYIRLGWHLGEYERGARICRQFVHEWAPELAPLPDGLTQQQQALFANEWALYLMNLGRLQAAARCYERSNAIDLEQRNWRDASIGNRNLAEVLCLSGQLKTALKAAETSLQLAQQAGVAGEQAKAYSCRAYVRTLRGDTVGALADFEEALKEQRRDEGVDRPLYRLGGIWYLLLLLRLGRNTEVTKIATAVRDLSLEFFGDSYHHLPKLDLILATAACERGEWLEAQQRISEARSWALPRDAKEPLCWSTLLQGSVMIAAAREDASMPASAPIQARWKAIQASVNEGLRLAMNCGYNLLQIDLLLLRARALLSKGETTAALADIHAVLGMEGEEESPRLRLSIPSTDPNCGYAWGEARARHLRAEALLIRAREILDRALPSQTNPERLPDVKAALSDAEEELTRCCRLRERLRDPALRATQQLMAALKSGQW
jgi:tetratricopeptide (TPR) repeat protein